MDNKERKLKAVLQDQKGGLDIDRVWAGIEGQLPRRKKRRVVVWLFLGLLLAGTGGVAAWIWKHESGISKEQEVLVSEVTRERSESTVSDGESDMQSEKVGEKREKVEDVQVMAFDNGNARSNIRKNLSESEDLGVKGSEYMMSNEFLEERFSSSRGIIGLKNRMPIEIAKLVKVPTLPELQVCSGILPTLCYNPSKFSVIALAGTNISFPGIKGLVDDSKEQGLAGFQSSLMVEMKLKKRWSVRAGLGYGQTIIRYRNESTTFSERFQEGVSEINISAVGVQEGVQGEVKTVVQENHDVTWHRRHRGLDLLFLMNKDIVLGRGWRMGLQGGINYNVYTSSQGYAYDFTEGVNFKKIESDVKGFYHRSWGLRPIAGVEVGYYMRNIELILNAHFVQNINPVNTLNNLYQIKHSQAGIQLGTRYILQGNKN